MINSSLDFGFTGTSEGMTVAQMAMFDSMCLGIKELHKGEIRFHHGDCVGADAQAHAIARKHGFYIIGHPPLDPKKRAFCECDELREEKEYLVRNKDIVAESTHMIATPRTDHELQRSGTWATVRYSRQPARYPCHIIWPDGSLALDVAAR